MLRKRQAFLHAAALAVIIMENTMFLEGLNPITQIAAVKILAMSTNVSLASWAARKAAFQSRQDARAAAPDMQWASDLDLRNKADTDTEGETFSDALRLEGGAEERVSFELLAAINAAAHDLLASIAQSQYDKAQDVAASIEWLSEQTPQPNHARARAIAEILAIDYTEALKLETKRADDDRNDLVRHKQAALELIHTAQAAFAKCNDSSSLDELLQETPMATRIKLFDKMSGAVTSEIERLKKVFARTMNLEVAGKLKVLRADLPVIATQMERFHSASYAGELAA